MVVLMGRMASASLLPDISVFMMQLIKEKKLELISMITACAAYNRVFI